MNLNFNVDFNDLHSLKGLKKIDKIFLNYLNKNIPTLYKKLLNYRLLSSKYDISRLEYSDFILELALYLDDFISELFSIEKENFILKKANSEFNIIYECRRKFVQRVFKNYPTNQITEIDFISFSQELTKILGQITEKIFAENVMMWLAEPEKFKSLLEAAAGYACYMVFNNSSLPLFNIPRAIDNNNLVRENKIQMLSKVNYIGFDYRDKEIAPAQALAHAKYCIYCHNQQKDSCRFGINEAKHFAEEGNGCPLDQQISEMNKIFAQGFNIGSLGIIIIDNPLVAATGHRICNDCMKSCIFQKQDPVNIPLIESTILHNVLYLPYGVEIYNLLTKWNPLNIDSPLPKETTNYNILVTGLGPAGFALSHYLLNEGHNVTAIDGLKIQQLDFDITKPIKNWQEIKVPLSKRPPQGFGGVAEYGITNRWDKNNLTLVRLLLERRSNFNMIGGIRLGSNIQANQAFKFGFDHIALCLGAGKPRYMSSASYFLKGVKSAADFLMNLQQGGSYLKESNSNLLIRMPAIVIGGGLTAIDSAVEVIHYYPQQVEKFLRAYEQGLVNFNLLSEEEKIIADEFINHAKLFRDASTDEEKLAIIDFLGGVSVCYRKRIKESPAYKRNHEEIEHAKAIGVKFIENVKIFEIKADKYDYINSIKFLDLDNNIHLIDAKNLLIAIGTEDNEFQDINNIHIAKNNIDDIFWDDERKFSHFGDCNQKYSGSVVKALASAKDGYKKITDELRKNLPKISMDFSQIHQKLQSTVYSIREISGEVIELIVKSPLAASNYAPGQFFRLQNLTNDITKAFEPLALSPYKVNANEGLISFIILKAGNSTKLCANLKEKEKIVLMGPTGSKTDFPKDKSVILIGSGIKNLTLLPMAEQLKKEGIEIIFFASYKKIIDRIYTDKIENIADKIIWSADDGLISCNRAQDISIKGNLIEAINSSDHKILFKDKNIICYVSDKLIPMIKENNLLAKASTKCGMLSPMQCMMKGICGQCIQKVNNNEGYIFACAIQGYNIRDFDSKALSNKLKQNSLLEQIIK